jgi:hypothetical protein
MFVYMCSLFKNNMKNGDLKDIQKKGGFVIFQCNCTSRLDLSNELLNAPNERLYAKVVPPGKLTHQLTTLGPTNLLVLHLLGLGFWTFRVL